MLLLSGRPKGTCKGQTGVLWQSHFEPPTIVLFITSSQSQDKSYYYCNSSGIGNSRQLYASHIEYRLFYLSSTNRFLYKQQQFMFILSLYERICHPGRILVVVVVVVVVIIRITTVVVVVQQRRALYGQTPDEPGPTLCD